MELRPYQVESVQLLRGKLKEGKKAILLCITGGGGKCHPKDTPVLMYDGSVKMVQDIKPGDQLMGDDSTPRNVLSTCTGREEIFNVIPKKGDIWGCNRSHVLSVIYTSGNSYGFKKGVPKNITIDEYLSLPELAKRDVTIYRKPVEFKASSVSIDPYFLGLWIGDGTLQCLEITNPDPEVIGYVKRFSSENGLNCVHIKPEHRCESLYFHRRNPKNKELLKQFRKLNLLCNKEKFIPREYLINSREIRLELLAGLIDSDGYMHHNGFEIITKFENLKNQILFLARSLGFAAYSSIKIGKIKKLNFEGKYYRITISGHTDQIQCKVERKKASSRKQIKDVLRTGFKIESIGEGDYYGFEIDGNHLYLLGDFTVTHNTVIASHMMEGAIKKGNPVLFIAHRKELIRQCVKKLSNFGINAGIIMSGEKENLSRMVQVASIQTLQRRDLPPAALVIVDECHRSISTQYLDILKYYKGTGSTIIGLTGTPFRTNKREGLNSLYDDFVANIQCSLLIEQGFISPVKVYGSGKISSKGMKSQAGEFREAELMKAFDTENVYVNLMINFEKYLKNEKTIVFCCSVAHSLKCTEVFLNAGYTAAHIDGNTPAGERDAIVEKFGKGEIQVLLNYGILAEGFDVPDCGGVILNLATKSKIKYLQACWRGSRVSPGKEYYTVIDMADNCERFGFPDEDIDVSLEPESETESSGVAPVKVCPDCSYMSFASAKCCPDCNHEFKKSKKEIEEEEFIELKRKQKEERKKKAWKNYGQKDWHKVSDEDLEEFGRIKKYSPVWAKMELQRRKEGRKIVKIVNYTGNDLYNKQKELQKIYDSKKSIDASEFVFQEETKVHIVFRYVKNQNQKPVNQ